MLHRCILYSLFPVFLLTGCGAPLPEETDKTVAETAKTAEEWPHPGTNDLLNEPVGIAVLNERELVVVHRGQQPPAPYVPEDVVLIVDRETGELVRSWGRDFFIKTHGLHVDPEGNVWVTDIGRHQVFKFTDEGELLLTLGEESKSGLSPMLFNQPTDVAVSARGTLFVTDGYGNRRVVKFSPSGRYLMEWGKEGKEQGEFINPHNIIITPVSQHLVVSDRENNRIQVFDTLGKHLRTISAVAPVYASSGDEEALYYTDYLVEGEDIVGSKIELTAVSSAKGKTVLSREKGQPGAGRRFHDLTVDEKGQVYVADLLNHSIDRFNDHQ